MGKIVESLAGVKTYLIAGIVVVCVLAEKFGGIDIPGFQVDQDWLGMILAALGLSALRAGVTKSGS